MSLRKSNFAIGQYLFSLLSSRWTVATIRIHGNYNLMVNKIVKPNFYFFPKIEKLFTKLKSGSAFSIEVRSIAGISAVIIL